MRLSTNFSTAASNAGAGMVPCGANRRTRQSASLTAQLETERSLRNMSRATTFPASG
jgi:hypothetical protein